MSTPVIRSNKFELKLESDSLREFCEKLIADGDAEDIRTAAYQVSAIWAQGRSKRRGK